MSTATAPAAERFWKDLEADLAPAGTRPLNVLFATDGSDPSQEAARFLSRLPLPAGSCIELLYALDPGTTGISPTLAADERGWGTASLDRAEAVLQGVGVEIARRLPEGAAAAEILKEARALDADLIVVGSHGRTGLAAFALGSVARSVARHADRPVLVAHAPHAPALRRVVVALDGSEHAAHALKLVASLPLPSETAVTLCHVVRPYVPPLALGTEYAAGLLESAAEENARSRARGEALLGAAAEALRATGREVASEVREGDPAAAILGVAEEQEADLVVAGARGVSGLEGLIVGSVADRLLTGARCSLLLVH